MERSWPLDQALHEVTNIRADLAVLLGRRPKAAKPPTWNPTGEKGRGKGGKKGEGKNTWITEMQINGEWKPLCLKYHLGQCKYPDCKYLHQCAFPRPDGTAWGQALGVGTQLRATLTMLRLPRLLPLCHVRAALPMRFMKKTLSTRHKMLRLPRKCETPHCKVLRLPRQSDTLILTRL